MDKPTIAITSGEPGGIGPELMAFINAQDYPARLVILGDEALIRQRAQAIGRPIQLQRYQPGQQAPEYGLEIKHIGLRSEASAGQLNAENAAYVLELLDDACKGCLSGEYQAMVTAPIQKDIINVAGIPFSGHTEYLADLCGIEKPVMLLATDDLRVALATTHLALREVADAINTKELERIIRIMANDLHKRFALNNPHIKVCGLNPHAGENGYLGREEIDIIIPLITRLQLLAVDALLAGLLSTLHQVRQGDVAQEGEDFVAELIPQGVGEAALPVAAVLTAPAASELHPLVHRADDVGDGNVLGRLAQVVAAAGAANPSDQLFAAQGREQLFQIGQRDALIDRDIGQCHGTFAGVQRQVQHRRHGISTFG